MKLADRLTLGALSVLLVAAVAGYVVTGSDGAGEAGGAPSASLIDRTPLRNAEALAPLASSAEERQLAHEALRLGDHAVDLSFTLALLDAAEHPPAPTPQTEELLQRIRTIERTVADDSARLLRLTGSRDSGAGAGEPQAELLRAQLELHRGELADARDDLLRAGGDPQGRIRQLVADHDSSDHAPGDAKPAPAAAATGAAATGADAAALIETDRGLVGRLNRWREIRRKAELLDRIQQETTAGIATLTAQRQTVVEHVDQVQGDSTRDLLARTRHLSADQKVLAGYNRRIEDQVGLLDVYSRWGGIVSAQRREALHGIFLDVAWILVILTVAVAVSLWLERVFVRLAPERRRLHTLRTVARFAVRGSALLGIALVLVGPPNQLATIIGLAGAGLTVVLQDFIVGFFGWFALMGRNGIRVGDWVEINGVSGEVVEITPFHTVLLETGNWTEAGHPTGRQVTFNNAYAIKGHYFNFSTTGQWLWDELEFSLPVASAPAGVEAIRRVVARETADNARLAEEEWAGASAARSVSEFAADPGIDVRPAGDSVRVVVRYITRAQERPRMRSSVYHAVIDALGQSPATSLPDHSMTQVPLAQPAER